MAFPTDLGQGLSYGSGGLGHYRLAEVLEIMGAFVDSRDLEKAIVFNVGFRGVSELLNLAQEYYHDPEGILRRRLIFETLDDIFAELHQRVPQLYQRLVGEALSLLSHKRELEEHYRASGQSHDTSNPWAEALWTYSQDQGHMYSTISAPYFENGHLHGHQNLTRGAWVKLFLPPHQEAAWTKEDLMVVGREVVAQVLRVRADFSFQVSYLFEVHWQNNTGPLQGSTMELTTEDLNRLGIISFPAEEVQGIIHSSSVTRITQEVAKHNSGPVLLQPYEGDVDAVFETAFASYQQRRLHLGVGPNRGPLTKGLVDRVTRMKKGGDVVFVGQQYYVTLDKPRDSSRRDAYTIRRISDGKALNRDHPDGYVKVITSPDESILQVISLGSPSTFLMPKGLGEWEEPVAKGVDLERINTLREAFYTIYDEIPKGFSSFITDAHATADGKFFVYAFEPSGGAHGYIGVVRVEDGQPMGAFNTGTAERIAQIMSTEDGRYLVLVAEDQSLLAFEINPDAEPMTP